MDRIFFARIDGDGPQYSQEVRQLGTYLKNWGGVERLALCGICHSDSLVEIAREAKNLFGPDVFIVVDGLIVDNNPEETKNILSKIAELGVQQITSDVILASWCHKLDKT